jgi:hypothetical protein
LRQDYFGETISDGAPSVEMTTTRSMWFASRGGVAGEFGIVESIDLADRNDIEMSPGASFRFCSPFYLSSRGRAPRAALCHLWYDRTAACLTSGRLKI